MNRKDKYLLGCLFAIHQLQEKGSTEYAVKVDGEWETIPWKKYVNGLKNSMRLRVRNSYESIKRWK